MARRRESAPWHVIIAIAPAMCYRSRFVVGAGRSARLEPFHGAAPPRAEAGGLEPPDEVAMVDALVALEIFGNGALGDVLEAYARSPKRLNVRFKAAQVA